MLIAVTAAGGLVLLSLATAWIVLRSKLRHAWMLDVLAMIPLGVPPLMIGVALVFVAFSLRFLPLYGTIWLIAIGHVIAFLPVASRMMQSGLLQIGSELEEAAAIAGASTVADLAAHHAAAAGADDRRDDHLDSGPFGARVLHRRHAAIGPQQRAVDDALSIIGRPAVRSMRRRSPCC